jgi:ABC-type molybdate transport system substrate-binding protein
MAEIRVLCSGAFRPAYLELVPSFEKATGHKVVTAWGSSVAGARAAQVAGAKALVGWLTSPAAAPAIRKSGMVPA